MSGDKVRFWLTRSPWLLVALLLCFPSQWLYGHLRAPASGAQIYIHTSPSRADVHLLTPDVGDLTMNTSALPPKPVGTTPGPLHLSYRDFPCTLHLDLWGFQPQSLYLRAGVFRPGVAHYPEQGAIPLTPVVPVLVPALYSMRDLPFLWLGCILLAACAMKLRIWMRTLSRDEQMRMRLELGDLTAGVPIGPYRLEDLLGVGGMARVYQARRRAEENGEVVALKILSARLSRDVEFRARFKREVNICRTLDHPNIVHLLDWGEVAGYLFLVMELVEGQTLGALAAERAVSTMEAVRLARQSADALLYAHRKGIVHRDVKPANIMVTPAGKAMLMDFGIARRVDLPTLTEAGHAMGTTAYMAPEQIRGQYTDWRCDYYSLGVTLYELLAGRHPYEGATGMEMLNRHVECDPPALRGDVPPDLARLVAQMMAKDARQRAGAMDEIPIALARIEAGGDPRTR